MSIPPEEAQRLRQELDDEFDAPAPSRMHVDGGLLFNERTGKADGAEVSVEVDMEKP